MPSTIHLCTYTNAMCLMFRSSEKVAKQIMSRLQRQAAALLSPVTAQHWRPGSLWDTLGHSDSESLWLQCFLFAQMKWEGHQTAATCSKQRLFFFRSPASAQHWSGGQGHFSHLCLYSVCGSLKSENSWVNSGPTQMRKLFCSIILIGSQTAASHWRLWEKN